MIWAMKEEKGLERNFNIYRNIHVTGREIRAAWRLNNLFPVWYVVFY